MLCLTGRVSQNAYFKISLTNSKVTVSCTIVLAMDFVFRIDDIVFYLKIKVNWEKLNLLNLWYDLLLEFN